jgi:anthranilate phosphoribosyltransferase
MSTEAENLMRSIIERIATGPEMSKNISESEAYEGMRAVLGREVGDVQAALFLIALRMKRETDEENRGVFRALMDDTVAEAVDVDELITVADAFNGFNRCLPMSPFLPPVLAACGLPTLSTGVETVAPKFGLTHHHILAAAGKSVHLEPAQAARQIERGGAGWAYLDQSATSPGLHRLRELRRLMVKRPVLSTCEVILRPLYARRNLACVGYVHTNYPRIYAMLAELAGYDEAVIVKGVEGGVIPSLQAASKLFRAKAGAVGEAESLRPERVGIRDAASRAVPATGDGLAVDAARAAEQGASALAGASGPARDSLVYGAAIALYATGRSATLEQGARTARRVLDSGEALARFQAAA